MKYVEAVGFLTADPDTRRKFLEPLIINNPRNERIKINRKYYDGEHWQIDGNTRRSNTTTQGKLIWGKVNQQTQTSDAYGRGFTKNDTTFHDGQLQVDNFVKIIGQLYQDFITKTGQKVTIDVGESLGENEENPGNYEEIEDAVKILWGNKNLDEFLSEQILRSYTDTVSVSRLLIDTQTGIGRVDNVDALEIFPIYKDSIRVGVAHVYQITNREAAIRGIITKKDEVTYAKFILPIEGRYLVQEFIDGQALSDEPIPMPDSINFDFYEITANINHPFKRFDDFTLEDSEIFSLIDKNDTLNAIETIVFISNLFHIQPRLVIDASKLSEMGITLDDPAVQQHINNYQFTPGAIDSLPVDVIDGHSLDKSTYDYIESLIQRLFEDAGIPRFLIDGSSMSNVSEQTVMLGMSVLIRKIDQKRERIAEEIKKHTFKYLKYKGLISEDLEFAELDITVNFPDLSSLNNKDMLASLAQFSDKLPQRYLQEQILELLGKSEDFEKVQAITNQEGSSFNILTQKIRANRNNIDLATKQAEIQNKIKQVDDELNSIED